MAAGTRAAAAKDHTELVLKIATALALSGHGEAVARMTGMARAFRADAPLWAVHKGYRGPRGRTALQYAAWAGDAARVRFLVELGPGEATALMFASEGGHLEAVRCLVEHGDGAVDAAAGAALKIAAHNGHHTVVAYLVYAGRVSAGACAAPALVACAWGRLELVRCLVQRGGVDVNLALSADGSSFLMVACENGHLEVVHFLVEHGGAAVNFARVSDGQTALLWACEKGHLDIARCLVQGGADVNLARAADGRTPLMCAAACGHLLSGESYPTVSVALVRLLLQHGADMRSLDVAGRRAFDFAKSFPFASHVRGLLE